MRAVWIASDNIVSPLGFTSDENYRNLKAGQTGIKKLDDLQYAKEPVYVSRISEPIPQPASDHTRFESLCILSIQNALRDIKLDPSSAKAIFILSSTKGNIELIEQGRSDNKRIHLFETASLLAKYFDNEQQPIVVSNACISGVMALLVAKRLIESGQYDHAIITGADVLSKFVLSGFQSLQAISAEPCKPFDENRKGVTLGEAAATIIISAIPESIGAKKQICIKGGGLSNDANHISGPSRTGEELATAVEGAINESKISKDTIDFISAHGTATLYNDEMEAKAFDHAGLQNIPLNSLKGYYGHTLGAAGIVEAIISVQSLHHNELIPTFGFEKAGVSKPVNVITKVESKQISTCLKTASGFGGCNAAMILYKVSL
jgi:3-oxoacyl-[acyl-carrier-protein] synthase-1